MTNQYSATLAVAFCVLVGTSAWEARGETTSYHIGNSLTWDSEPLALEAFAQMRGLEHRIGYHIHSGWSLNAFIQDPNEVSMLPIEEFGKYSTALVNFPWDAVTLQPHPNGVFQSTLGTDVDSILSFIDLTRTNPANADTTFYVYAGWPSRIDFPSEWTAAVANELDTPTVRSREYYNHLIERVRAETDASVLMIPVGEVLFELYARMQAGQVPGFSQVNDLYRDHTHLTNKLGRYMASVTTFATLFDETPLGLTKPAGFFQDQLFPLSSEQYESVHKAIRDVLNADPDSGVYFPQTDFDNNQIIDSADLLLWEKSYPGPRYDVNRDGEVSGADFLEWQRSYNTDPPEFVESPANLDQQGLVDSDDIRIWEQSYAVGDVADLDGDADTDGFDFLELQREITPFAVADKNRDRLVDGRDLEFWNESFGYDGVVDADDDGLATGLDFLWWQREVSRSSTVSAGVFEPAAQSVPEPGGIAWLVLAGCLLAQSTYRLRPR